MSDAFKVSHDTELDSTGTVWNVGGGGAAGYQLTANPLAPQLLGTTGDGRAESLALQRLHPPQLAAAREDAAGHGGGLHRHRRGPARRLPRPGQVRDLGSLAAGQGRDHAARHLGDGAERHVHRRRGRLEGAGDRQLLVALVRRQGRRRGRRLVRAGRPLPRLPHADRRSRQVGYYIPANGSTWAAYWSPTDPKGEIVYTADAYRGVDVLRIDGGGPDRQEGEGAGPQRVVRQPDRRLRVVPAAPRLGFMCPVLKPDVDTP